jgi:hypothetical protein
MSAKDTALRHLRHIGKNLAIDANASTYPAECAYQAKDYIPALHAARKAWKRIMNNENPREVLISLRSEIKTGSGRNHLERAIADLEPVIFRFVKLLPNANWQTKARGTNEDEYDIYRTNANDGKGGDITRNHQPLLTYEEWLNA